MYSTLGCSFPSTNKGTNTPNPTYIKPVDNSVPITPSTTQSPDDPIYQKAMKLGYPDKTAREISMIWNSYPGDRTALGVLWDADPTATEKFAEDGKLTDLKQTFLKTLNRLDVSFTYNIQKDSQVSVEPFELTLTGIDTGFFNEYAGNITQDTNKLLEKAVNVICNSTVEPYTLAVYNLWEQVEKPSYKTPRIKVSEGLPSVFFLRTMKSCLVLAVRSIIEVIMLFWMERITHIETENGTRGMVLFNWETGLEVGYLKKNTVLFSEQRVNVTSFVKVLRGWNGASLVLVYYFCKVDCRNYVTGVIR